jgi:4-amino-4-deoxy-L-arabinose transferase-like glycosyltransferase
MIKILSELKKTIIKNKWIVFLSILYFVFRLINLTKLPIFNDEAIYLDWGWRETHRAGFLYYSLYDAKQPLLMWIFGIAESIISDPLFAGRFVSVVTGFLTLIGVYKLARYSFKEKVALVSVLFYIVIPIFSFYDRQALMESSIAAVGIWSCFFLLKSLKENSLVFSALSGITLGIGFFIKSSSLVFIFSYVLIIIVYIFFSKKIQIVNHFFTMAGFFLISISLLLINPQFWDTLASNSRYSLTVNELLNFPIGHWFNSLFVNIQIAFFHTTPLFFLIGLAGIVYILAKKKIFNNLFLLFFLLSFSIATFLVRVPTDRYLISFLPFLVIPVSYVIIFVLHKNKNLGAIFVFIIFVIPLCLTLLEIVNPIDYFLLTGRYTPFGNSGYLQGATSGYAVNDAIAYFQKTSESSKIIISIGENTGNPESAISDYFYKNPNVQVVYLDSRLFGQNISLFDCFSSSVPLFFVAREEQLVGLDKYLQKLETIRNPYGLNTIGIYILKKNCKGKTFNLQISTT